MSRLRDSAVRLVNLFRRERIERELDAELQAYLELDVEENIRRGMAPREARRMALARLGGAEVVKDQCRDVQRLRVAEDLWRDLRYGFRRLLARPILAVVAVAVLAIGIGANVAILALVDALLLRPLPGADPSRLVAVFTSDYSSGRPLGNSYPDFLDIRDSTRDVFENVTAASIPAPVGVRIGGETRVMSAQTVEPNYFDTMGLRPVHGRGFEAVETGAVAVISHGAWLSEFGGDPSVLGRAITINGSPFTVVGVAPAELASAQGIPLRVDVRLPLAFAQLVSLGDDRLQQRGSRGYFIVGRLRDRVGIGDARTVLEVVGRRLHQSYPEEWTALSGQPRALTVREASRSRLPSVVSGPVVGGLAVLTGLVVILLLIVCANISGLLLADASVRRREMSIRQALGASRLRLIRQVVVESLGLGLVGGCLGVAAASAALRFVTLLLPDLPVPVQLDLELGGRLLVAPLVVSSSVGLAVGVLPALYATQPRLRLGRFLQTRFRNALTAMQAAAAVFLLIIAGAFARSIVSAYALPLGYDPDELVLVAVDLETAGYSEDRGRAYLRQALEQMPTAEVSEFPLLSLQAQSRRGFTVDGYQPGAGESMAVNRNTVSPGYISLMGVPFVRGRDLKSGERNAVLVNRAFARRFWSGQNAVGRRVGSPVGPPPPGSDSPDLRWSTVVGVVEDAHFVSFREAAIPVVFQLMEDVYSPQVTFHMRGVSAEAARRAIERIDPAVPVVSVTTMSETVDMALLPARIAAGVSGLVGAVGLALACIGLFGTLSYVVAQRAPEIGLRVALGARALQIIRLVAGGTSVKLVAAGVVLGAGLGSGLAPLLQAQFSGAGGVDLVTLAGAAACLALVASVAIGVPAARALRIDPAEVLRVVE
ncbi:MAG: ABC transporter permease [Acidobacteria bacterium]|nr:ABC transporter permease [Acidobacteriota bacterium]